jgi:hypothetical protein
MPTMGSYHLFIINPRIADYYSEVDYISGVGDQVPLASGGKKLESLKARVLEAQTKKLRAAIERQSPG